MNIGKLAAELAAGSITEEIIRAKFGPSILAAVLALGAGAVAANIAGSIFEETGVSDLVEDVFSIF